MISRVLLRNWRGYEKLSLDLGEGLTFVIADNGVGKTSLVSGVAWAIFGEAADVDAPAAIRAGTDETVAEVDFVVADATFSVSRALGRQHKGRSTVQVEVDGARIDPADLPGRLAQAASVPHDSLPPLMFVPEMQLTHEGELFADVQDHLAALLGIADLRRAARVADEIGTRANRKLRAAREVARLDEKAVAGARARIADIVDEQEQLAAAMVEDGERHRQLEAEQARLAEWQAYDDRLARYQQELQRLAEQARAAGVDPEPEQVATSEARLQQESRDLGAAAAEARAEESLVHGLVEQLGQAGAVCPVCLRAIDEDVAAHAAQGHHSRLAELAARRAEAERRRLQVEAAVEEIRAVADALAGLRPPEPPRTARPEGETTEGLAARKAEVEAALAQRLARQGALGEQLSQAEQTIREAEASQQASRELVQQHSLAAASSALAQLARGEADRRTERSLDPISRALARRWAEFFTASSSHPRLAGGGSIELGQGIAAIPYTSFSGGEKTLASLLTRLLFVTSATDLHCMWLDEPLEHLDPANRTRLARLLAQVAQPGNHMRQVVVTTYEEGLARSMLERDEATSVVYVSTDELL